jgi:uncharacterized membrane protein
MTAVPWKTLILSLSLGLNCLLGGIWLGQHWFAASSLGERPLLQIARSLPPEMRPKVRQALFEQRGPLKEAIAETRQAVQHIQSLVLKAEVEPIALQQAFDGLHNSLNHLQQPLYSAMIQAIISTPAEVRQRWQAPLPGLIAPPIDKVPD